MHDIEGMRMRRHVCMNVCMQFVVLMLPGVICMRKERIGKSGKADSLSVLP